MNLRDDLSAHISKAEGRPPLMLASSVEKNIPVYDCRALVRCLEPGEPRQSLMAELAQNLLKGSGAFVLRSAFEDTKIVDQATAAFLAIIADEKASKGKPPIISPPPVPMIAFGTALKNSAWPILKPLPVTMPTAG